MHAHEKYITLIKQTSNKSSVISVAKHAVRARARARKRVYAPEREFNYYYYEHVAAGRRGLHATDGCNATGNNRGV